MLAAEIPVMTLRLVSVVTVRMHDGELTVRGAWPQLVLDDDTDLAR